MALLANYRVRIISRQNNNIMCSVLNSSTNLGRFSSRYRLMNNQTLQQYITFLSAEFPLQFPIDQIAIENVMFYRT